MARRIVDLSQLIYQGTPVYPGHVKTVIWEHHTHEETRRAIGTGFSYTTRGLLLSDHGPTHVDAINHINPALTIMRTGPTPRTRYAPNAVC